MITGNQFEFVSPGQLLDPILELQRSTAITRRALEHQGQRGPATEIPRGLRTLRLMFRKPSRNVSGNAGVQTAVRAAHQVNGPACAMGFDALSHAANTTASLPR